MESLQPYKPLTLVALVVLVVATMMGWMWVWGILYLYWAVTGIVSGGAYVVEDIARADNPVLFWLINALWAAAGLWAVSTAFLDQGV